MNGSSTMIQQRLKSIKYSNSIMHIHWMVLDGGWCSYQWIRLKRTTFCPIAYLHLFCITYITDVLWWETHWYMLFGCNFRFRFIFLFILPIGPPPSPSNKMIANWKNWVRSLQFPIVWFAFYVSEISYAKEISPTKATEKKQKKKKYAKKKKNWCELSAWAKTIKNESIVYTTIF